MHLFTITATGRLIYHKCRYYASRLPEPVADIDMEYHGDIEIHGLTLEGKAVRYAVRFTHGTAEWIKPLEELSERHRFLLLERG
jgi:hypothetical protein